MGNKQPNTKPIESWMCGARLRNKPGLFCHRPKLKGLPRCRLHGGKSMRGAEIPWFKNGERSKYLPSGWLENYERYLESKDVSLERELALSSILLDEALLAVKEASPITVVKDLRKKVIELKTAISMPSTEAADIARLIGDLDRMTSHGEGVRRAQRDLVGAIDFRSKIAMREWKRQMDMGAVMTATQAAIFIRAFQESIKRYVTDPSTIAKIIAHIAPAVNAGNVREPAVDVD